MSAATRAVFEACFDAIAGVIGNAKGVVCGRDTEQVPSETESLWVIEPTEMVPPETQNDWHEYDITFTLAGLYAFSFGDASDWSFLQSQVDDICNGIDSLPPSVLSGGTIQRWIVKAISLRREPDTWQVFAELSVRANITLTR